MFCIQCEQTIITSQAKGCSYSRGMCGKTAQVSDLQDLLITSLQRIAFWVHSGQRYAISDPAIDRWCFQAFFATLTNVNFDADRIVSYIREGNQYAAQLQQRVSTAAVVAGEALPHLTAAAQRILPDTRDELMALAPQVRLNREQASINQDVLGLRLLALYGLKGAAAYLEHAAVLHQYDAQASAEFHRIMQILGDDPCDMTLLLELTMAIGALNYQVMAMLDHGETQTFGHPEPTQVNTQPIKGQCILVSGHDFHDLQLILEQTAGLGIHVFTHGEMLPAHAYPALKKYPHLVGNYGSAWQSQQSEFAQFPGPIVMTSNCIIDPFVGDYADRIFTRNMVGWPGVRHISGDDFSEVIHCAQSQPGFAHTCIEQMITIGFARNTLMNVAPAVIDEIKAGHISHFYLIGGCDGSKSERHYYTEMANQVPKDSVILTLGCGKYRFNKQQFGEINGIPRLLDLGQCNDAYSAIQLALALADTFGCSVNELPLTLVLSWFEQKAIVILLTLLSLGVKGIYTGPTLPAFLTDNVIAILQEKFDIRPTTCAADDLAAIMASKAA